MQLFAGNLGWMAEYIVVGQIALDTLLAAEHAQHVEIVVVSVDLLDVPGQHELQLRTVAALGTRVNGNGYFVDVHVPVERLFVRERFLANRAYVFLDVGVFGQDVVVQRVLLQELLRTLAALELFACLGRHICFFCFCLSPAVRDVSRRQLLRSITDV